MDKHTPEYAALVERVSHIQATLMELRDTVNRMADETRSVHVIQNDIEHLDAKVERSFNAIEKLANVTNSNTRVIAQLSAAKRIAAAMIAASAAIVGWGWNTIDAIHRDTTSLDTRVTFMERANHVQQAAR